MMPMLFTDSFMADLTAEVNRRRAWIAQQPISSVTKLEQEIAAQAISPLNYDAQCSQ